MPEPLIRTLMLEHADEGEILDRINPEPGAADRFALEAAASLPGVAHASDRLDDYYAGLALQRVRLKHNQQAPEWTGERYLRESL